VHVPVPAVLFLVVCAAALAVALTDLGSHALAGGVVLAGLAARWALRHRRPHPAAVPVEAPAAAG
jgi:hypothetical protein